MAPLDLFGLKKDAPADEPEGAAPAGPAAAPAARMGAKAWRGFLAADAALLVAFGTLLGVRVKGHLRAPAAVPRRTAPARPQPPTPAKAPEPVKPAPPEPEPATPEAKKPQPAPKREAKPLGSPAVHAAPPPERKAAPKEAAAPAVPAKRATRPVPFSYSDANAKEVYLMGPFLVHGGGRKRMFKDSQGVWRTTVYLNVGQTYKYRFELVGAGGRRLSTSRKVEVLAGD